MHVLEQHPQRASLMLKNEIFSKRAQTTAVAVLAHELIEERTNDARY